MLEQNARKQTPLKIQFYSQLNITLPTSTISKAKKQHCFFHVSFSLFVAARWKFASWLSNCSNLINFEAKINCNTTRQNDLKCRKTCTGLKFDLDQIYWWQLIETPCTYSPECALLLFKRIHILVTIQNTHWDIDQCCKQRTIKCIMLIPFSSCFWASIFISSESNQVFFHSC